MEAGDGRELESYLPQKGQFNVRLMSTEMSAMSGMPASKTLRLAPAMGRRRQNFLLYKQPTFKIDKAIFILKFVLLVYDWH